jgi:ribosomal-protein-alanine N-acetyltransferase
MDRDFQILPATAEMLTEILELEEACFSAPWTRKMLAAELSGNPFACFLVATVQDATAALRQRIVGYHCVWIVFEELRLMNLAVRESARRRGIGRALAAEAIGVGLARGATRAVLEVRRSNETAQGLYRGLGFVPISTRRQYYSTPVEDAVLMEMDPLVMPADGGHRRISAAGAGSVSAHEDNPGGVVCRQTIPS